MSEITKRLTKKEREFARAYVSSDGNARSSLMIAGYEQGVHAKALIEQPHIQAEIERLQSIKDGNADISTEWVLGKLKTIVERSLQAEPVYDKHGNPTGEYKNDSPSAIKALEQIGKHIGFYEANNRQKQSLTQNNIQHYDLSGLSKEELELWLKMNEKMLGEGDKPKQIEI